MQTKEKKNLEDLTRIYTVLMFVVIGILITRLAWLQLVDTEVYASRADAQRNRLMTITATRGDIVTSDGTVLVTDRPSYQLTVEYLSLREDGEYNEELIRHLVELVQDPALTVEKVKEICDANSGYLYKPVVLKKNLDIATVSRIEANRDTLPGVSVETVPERTYLHGTLASHVLGYIGEISQSELETATLKAEETGEENIYKMGDNIGKVGLENYYDKILRGTDGYRQVEVNAGGRPVSDVRVVEPEAGNSLVLTIDADLQQALEYGLDSTIASLQSQSRSDKAGAGAGVLINVKTGEILAMASRPEDNVGQQNRAIQGRYIPGSTFKPVTAIAALETNVVSDTEMIYNPGRYWIAPFIKTTAPVGYYNLYNGMAKSDNVYFQEIGRRAGIDSIAKYGEMLGLEGPTGIDLAYESTGERATQGLPTKEKRQMYQDMAAETSDVLWDRKIAALEEEKASALAAASTEEEKKKVERKYNSQLAVAKSEKLINHKWNSEWHAADTFNVAIGQGRQNYTPLQLAVYAAALANGGTVYQPYVVKEIRNNAGEVIETAEPVVRQQADISEDTLIKVRNAMCKVTDNGGGAYGLFANFPADIKVAAKTGTAQPGGKGYRVGNKEYYDGLFICFAPADDPEVAFACIMEYGYSGSGSAGRVAKIVLEEYFGLNGQ
ncbi:MAG: penicillin-binding protein 2 [Peptococcaceae bacterium]|nr:penicillin-binding protein 2 [Peptococcaceae bacterium]